MKKIDPYKPQCPLHGGAVFKGGKATKGGSGRNPKDYCGVDKKRKSK